MIAQKQHHTLAAFEAFITQPENAENLYEFIGGEIVEVPSNPYASAIAMKILVAFGHYLAAHSNTYHITGEAGGYQIGEERYAPDVALLAKDANPTLATNGYHPNPPQLAVEVEFPTSAQSERRLRVKLLHYLAAGVVVWVVYPETGEVEVYTPGEMVRVLSGDDVLDGGALLPEFTLKVRTIFEG